MPTLIKDAFYQANFVGRDGDCPCHVCVRLLSHVDAGCRNAMLRYDALLVARPRPQPGMLQDHAVYARSFCTAGLRARSLSLDCFRRRAAGFPCIASFGFSIERSYGAVPRAANSPISSPFTSSHLISLPVVTRLRGQVCLGTLLSAGRKNNGFSKRKSSRAILGARFDSGFAFCFDSWCARSCARDGASALPGRRTNLLQLHFHHTRPSLRPVWQYPLDGPSYVFARR